MKIIYYTIAVAYMLFVQYIVLLCFSGSAALLKVQAQGDEESLFLHPSPCLKGTSKCFFALRIQSGMKLDMFIEVGILKNQK